MAKSAQREKGIAKFQEVMGVPPPEVDDPFFDMTLDHLFPNVWGRGGLSRRERRLVTLTVLSCLGHEPTLKMHLTAATRSGDLSDADIDELMIHLAHYAGWPVAAMGSTVARQLRAQR
ncbi:MAG TPA: carboxymuconolactone decarboxylase family protein [Candidatus Binatia bacterium]|nr:carboxymuconolactone decarboxylase family protein [Candidatus Binatia bacterium]